MYTKKIEVRVTSAAILILVISAAILVPVSANNGIISHWSNVSPTIDGNFTDGEWKNAQLLIESPIHTYVYFSNDGKYLYACVDAANAADGDYTEDYSDQCSLHFDTGHDEVNTTNHEDVFWIGDWGNQHFVASDGTFIPVFHCSDWPGTHPGLQGSIGFAVSPNSAKEHRIYEFKIPLGLLEAAPGDTLGFASPQFYQSSIPYDDNSSSHNVWPPGATMDNMSTWGDLILASPPQAPALTPIGLLALISLLSAIAVVTIVRKRH